MDFCLAQRRSSVGSCRSCIPKCVFCVPSTIGRSICLFAYRIGVAVGLDHRNSGFWFCRRYTGLLYGNDSCHVVHICRDRSEAGHFLRLNCSAFSHFLGDSSLLVVFGLCRILTGFGCGGSVPIAYTRTSSSRSIGYTFSLPDSSEASSTGSILLLLQSSSWVVSDLARHD